MLWMAFAQQSAYPKSPRATRIRCGADLPELVWHPSPITYGTPLVWSTRSARPATDSRAAGESTGAAETVTGTGIRGIDELHRPAMAAHVFPLVVTLQLADEGRYALTQGDEVRCLVVDKLLASPQ